RRPECQSEARNNPPGVVVVFAPPASDRPPFLCPGRPPAGTYTLSLHDALPILQLVHTVTGLMGNVYPELVQKRSHLESVTRAEEERFFDTIEGGLERLEQLRGAKAISGAEAFKLYDTFGFPIDLTQLIAGERGQAVDVAGFERELGKQRTRSLEALERSKGGDAGKVAVHVKRGGEWRTVKPRAKQKWVGYDTTQAETDVLRFRQASDVVEV